MAKGNPEESGDRFGEIAHLDWHPAAPEALGALSDMAALDTKTWAEEEVTDEPWSVRHARLLSAGLFIALIAQPVAGEVFIGGHWEAQTHSDELHRAAAYQRCEVVAKKRDDLGFLATRVHISTLSEQQQKDCGYEHASFYVNTTSQTISTPDGVGGEIITPAIDPLVELPSLNELEVAHDRELSLSGETQYLERIMATFAGVFSAALTAAAFGIYFISRDKKVAKLAEAKALGEDFF